MMLALKDRLPLMCSCSELKSPLALTIATAYVSFPLKGPAHAAMLLSYSV